MSPSAVTARLTECLLGREKAQRVRASYTLVAVAVYLLFALLQHAEVVLGLIDRRASHALTLFNLAGSLGVYGVVRSGWNLRIAPADPSLSLPFGLFAMVSVVWAYAITGPARGAVLGIFVLIMLFGVFQLQSRQIVVLGSFGFGLLAAVMGWRSLGDAPIYDPRVELVHLVFAAITAGAAAVLAVRFGRLRSRLARQRAELAQALEVNRQLATHDALTGMLNRRAMVELLATTEPRPELGDGCMSVAILDIDHFKRINDEFGHAMGDAVLQRFAQIARSELHPHDTLARWGGEEFLLLMPGTTPAVACLTLEWLRGRVAEGDFASPAGPLALSFSAGLTGWCRGEHHEVAIERADVALYRAKRNGRNRVELEVVEPVAVAPRPVASC